MQEYNDFALPSIENIEQMAQAYQKYKQKDNISKMQNAEQMKKLKNCIYNFCNCIDYLYSKNKSNCQLLNLYNLAKKLKLDIDSELLEKGVECKTNILKANDNNVLYNVLLSYNGIMNLFIANIGDKMFFNIAQRVTAMVKDLCS